MKVSLLIIYTVLITRSVSATLLHHPDFYKDRERIPSFRYHYRPQYLNRKKSRINRGHPTQSDSQYSKAFEFVSSEDNNSPISANYSPLSIISHSDLISADLNDIQAVTYRMPVYSSSLAGNLRPKYRRFNKKQIGVRRQSYSPIKRYNEYENDEESQEFETTTSNPTTTTPEPTTTTEEPFDVSDIKVPTPFLRQEYFISFTFMGLMYGLGFLVFFQSLCIPLAKIGLVVLTRLGLLNPTYSLQDVLEHIPPDK